MASVIQFPPPAVSHIQNGPGSILICRWWRPTAEDPHAAEVVTQWIHQCKGLTIEPVDECAFALFLNTQDVPPVRAAKEVRAMIRELTVLAEHLEQQAVAPRAGVEGAEAP